MLNSTKGRVLRNPDLKVTMTRPALLAMVLQGKKLRELVQAGLVKVEGDPTGAIENNILTFEPLFPIVAP